MQVDDTCLSMVSPSTAWHSTCHCCVVDVQNLDARLEGVAKLLLNPVYALIGSLMYWLPDNKQQRQVEDAIRQVSVCFKNLYSMICR